VADQLREWEGSFEEKVENLDATTSQKSGALLPLIPDRAQWSAFLATVQSEWNTWERDLVKYPACLIILYGGLAFYEYDEREFWPPFAKAIGKDSIPPNQQTEINQAFTQAAEHFG
jgi:hypothetical protein